jgi:hypothetical protein
MKSSLLYTLSGIICRLLTIIVPFKVYNKHNYEIK